MMLDKVKVVLAGVLILGGVAGGGAAVGRQIGGGAAAKDSTPTKADPRASDAEAERELMKAISEVEVARADLSRAKSRLDRAMAEVRQLQNSPSRREAAEALPAARLVEVPVAPKAEPRAKRESASTEDKVEKMKNERRGPLIVGYDHDKGRARVVNLNERFSTSYKAADGIKVTPIYSGLKFIGLQMEGLAINEVALYSIAQKKWVVQKLSRAFSGTTTPASYGGGGPEVGVVTLSFEGPEIHEIAAYSEIKGRWTVQKLEETAHGRLMWHQLAPQIVSHLAGRYLYAFSGETGTWDVLEMPDASPITVESVEGSNYYVMQWDDNLHVFDSKIGKWDVSPPASQ